ncbi:hypothetical protein HDU96_002522 [Phlyctochytrium bullatum]|nr:hypothetical protein HDU96_002522 [Phlyctochytrium bullatum]
MVNKSGGSSRDKGEEQSKPSSSQKKPGPLASVDYDDEGGYHKQPKKHESREDDRKTSTKASKKVDYISDSDQGEECVNLVVVGTGLFPDYKYDDSSSVEEERTAKNPDQKDDKSRKGRKDDYAEPPRQRREREEEKPQKRRDEEYDEPPRKRRDEDASDIASDAGSEDDDDIVISGSRGFGGSRFQQGKMGQIVPPTKAPPVRSEKPKEDLVLEYVHGYRMREVNNNAYYLSSSEIVFPAGSMGIVMNTKSNTQKFFQGRHKEDVTGICLDPEKKFVATGDIVSHSDGTFVYIWDASNPEDRSKDIEIRVGEGKLARGVADLQFSPNGEYLVVACMDDNKTIFIYTWKKCVKTILKHESKSDPGGVYSVQLDAKNNKLISGGKDGMIKILDLNTLDTIDKVQMSAGVRSIDISPTGDLLVGLESSVLFEITGFGGAKKGNVAQRLLLEGHSAQKTGGEEKSLHDNKALTFISEELWGLATDCRDSNIYVTLHEVYDYSLRPVVYKENFALFQSVLIYILNSSDLSVVVKQKYQPAKESNSKLRQYEAIRFSPNEKYLAAGGHDRLIHVFEFSKDPSKGLKRACVCSQAKMENDKGQIVDLYIPRKCSATGRLITAKDHAAVQINIGEVDATGRYTGQTKTYALSGFVRSLGESDDSLNRLATQDGYLKNVWSYSK